MTPAVRVALALVLAGALAPAAVTAQAPAETPAQTPEASRFWLVAGGGFSTVRGDCQTCEADYPYRHSGSVLANIGYRANRRMDVGVEFFWMPIDTADGSHIRTTHIDAIAQFRPWQSKGFFIKGGAGMGFLRNWVDVATPDAINSKALSVVIGAGWEFRRGKRVGYQLFGAQHAAAVGDLATPTGMVPDVIGNFWTLGAGIVIR